MEVVLREGFVKREIEMKIRKASLLMVQWSLGVGV